MGYFPPAPARLEMAMIILGATLQRFASGGQRAMGRPVEMLLRGWLAGWLARAAESNRTRRVDLAVELPHSVNTAASGHEGAALVQASQLPQCRTGRAPQHLVEPTNKPACREGLFDG